MTYVSFHSIRNGTQAVPYSWNWINIFSGCLKMYETPSFLTEIQKRFRINGLAVTGNAKVEMVTDGGLQKGGIAHLADDRAGCYMLSHRDRYRLV